MKKIKIEICTGTACYLMGSGELIELLENLPESFKEHIDLKGTACQGFCRAGSRPPFVSINGTITGEMNSAQLLATITDFFSESQTGGYSC